MTNLPGGADPNRKSPPASGEETSSDQDDDEEVAVTKELTAQEARKGPYWDQHGACGKFLPKIQLVQQARVTLFHDKGIPMPSKRAGMVRVLILRVLSLNPCFRQVRSRWWLASRPRFRMLPTLLTISLCWEQGASSLAAEAR
jgi:hypothetical protein